MEPTEIFHVPRWTDQDGHKDIIVSVPGSKSITNRALLLAALGTTQCVLQGVLFSDDSRAMMDCLGGLGFRLKIDEAHQTVVIWGEGGRIPCKEALINVRSAGTAARFLTVLLALAGGRYTLDASPQMRRRPMATLLTALRQAGADIECLEQEGYFPFRINRGVKNMTEVTVDTNISSQFASALLMAGGVCPGGLRVRLIGERTGGAYIGITLRMMEQFGRVITKESDGYSIPPIGQFNDQPGQTSGDAFRQDHGITDYRIEPDVSGACYFYACAPLLGTDVLVRQVHRDSMQGDIRFVELLEQLGCRLEDSAEGLWVRGRSVEAFPGLTVDMKDFSDQTMTMAALAPFATTATTIRAVGHIRFQESDRIGAIVTELTRIGIACEATDAGDIMITPGPLKGGAVETYEDHRMAMAFTLIGLKTGAIAIKNPGCCAKTFENFFTLIDDLFKTV
ncbi:MAG: 3-phosphoshikimate 1-carboxyvinyltransferase [Lachnospiraceae bacterium]|nr:3-phosphoshikimate 1-carboxyvinyltransferase [Lachnospiraceae bacterium]